MADRIAVFSGTSDGRKIASMLSEEFSRTRPGTTVSEYVATDYGRDLAGEESGIDVRSGRLNENEMERELGDVCLVIDATHPFATEVTMNIREASEKLGIRYLRLLREETMTEDGVTLVADTEEAAEYLSGREGNVLLTTGSKELHKYSKAGPERLFARVLPLESSITQARDAGIPVKNIIGMQGPFTDDFNRALIRFYNIDIMVTKDSGAEGGFDDKIRAARESGVECVVIRRPGEEGYPLGKIFELAKEFMECM